MRIIKIMLVLVFLLNSVLLFSETKIVKNGEKLQPGKSISTALKADNSRISSHLFIITIPENEYGMKISLYNADQDLDLFVSYGSPVEDLNFAELRSESESGKEEVILTKTTESPLLPGLYYVYVAFITKLVPEEDGTYTPVIPFTIKYELLDFPVYELEPGQSRKFTLQPDTAMAERFKIAVPKGVKALRFDILHTSGDVDFIVSRENPMQSISNCDYIKNTFLSREHLLIPGDKIEAGNYYITVFENTVSEYPVNVTLVVSFKTQPPLDRIYSLQAMIKMKTAKRAAAATVGIVTSVSNGSGCLISKDGYILTNYHVIKGLDGKPEDKIWISVNTNFTSPPLELFSAKVIETKEKDDLALLKITGTFYGNSLPEDYKFPYYPLGNDEKAEFGDTIFVIGYPLIGGTGSKVSVTMTSGIISGFEIIPNGFLLKTDAVISFGNSGGAVVDEKYRLIGLSSSIIGQGMDQMGFIHPLNLVPDEWLVKAGIKR